MDAPSRKAGRRVVAALLLALALAATIPVFGIFVRKPGINGYSRAMFLDMIYGRAHRPFVLRALVPTTVRVLTSAIPEGARGTLNAWILGLPKAQRIVLGLEWEKDSLVEYAIALGLMYAALVGFVFALRSLCLTLYETPPEGANLAALLAVSGLPLLFRYYSYLYDLPCVLFFTLGLAFMAKRRWLPFLAIFLIGALNKETTLLLSVVFVLHFMPLGPSARMDRKTFVRLLAAQAFLFLAVKTVLTFAFRDNPGGTVEFHLLDHNLPLLKDYLLPYGPAPLVVALVLALLFFARLGEKPLLLRHGLVLLPILLGLTTVLGYFDEWRDYYEAYPIVVLLAFANIAALAGIPAVSRQAA